MRNELWVCGGRGEHDLHLYSIDLESRGHVTCSEVGVVRGVADTGECVVMAASKGLYRASYAGELEPFTATNPDNRLLT